MRAKHKFGPANLQTFEAEQKQQQQLVTKWFNKMGNCVSGRPPCAPFLFAFALMRPEVDWQPVFPFDQLFAGEQK